MAKKIDGVQMRVMESEARVMAFWRSMGRGRVSLRIKDGLPCKILKETSETINLKTKSKKL